MKRRDSSPPLWPDILSKTSWLGAGIGQNRPVSALRKIWKDCSKSLMCFVGFLGARYDFR